MSRTKRMTWAAVVIYVAAFWAWLFWTCSASAAPSWQYTKATWYGPGFYGNGMACGGTYTIKTRGIAHPSLPCGTRVTIVRRGVVTRVTVRDRSGGAFDLSARTAMDLCNCWSPYTMNVRWTRGWYYGSAVRL